MSEKKPQEASGENPNYDPYAEIEHYRQLAIEMEVKADALAAQLERVRAAWRRADSDELDTILNK